MEPIITSILDEDLYKFSQQLAICQLYPNAVATYTFINRGNTYFPPSFATELNNQIQTLAELKATPEEIEFLREKCYFFSPVYLDFLAGYRYNPDEVHVTQSDEHLSVKIEGPWFRAVLWEVKLLAIISELYFKLSQNIEMTESHILSPMEALERAQSKAEKLIEHGLVFADFGTRRRFSRQIHEAAYNGLIQGTLNTDKTANVPGTSNVKLAMMSNTTPIGTIAHEFIQGVSALKGLRRANAYAMEDWINVYQGDLGIALTDTFGTKAFWEDFGTKYAKLFNGIRQDSGSAIDFGHQAIKHYEKLGIDPLSKTIVFSDGLDVGSAINIHAAFKDKIKMAFGIGTHFSNSVGCKPLNIVIKLTQMNGIPVVKLSDSPGKETGDPKAIEYTKWIFGIQ